MEGWSSRKRRLGGPNVKEVKEGLPVLSRNQLSVGPVAVSAPLIETSRQNKIAFYS